MRCLRSRPPPLGAGLDKNRRAQHASSEAGVKGKGTTKKGLKHSSKPFFEVPSRIELLYAVLQTVA